MREDADSARTPRRAHPLTPTHTHTHSHSHTVTHTHTHTHALTHSSHKWDYQQTLGASYCAKGTQGLRGQEGGRPLP